MKRLSNKITEDSVDMTDILNRIEYLENNTVELFYNDGGTKENIVFSKSIPSGYKYLIIDGYWSVSECPFTNVIRLNDNSYSPYIDLSVCYNRTGYNEQGFATKGIILESTGLKNNQYKSGAYVKFNYYNNNCEWQSTDHIYITRVTVVR